MGDLTDFQKVEMNLWAAIIVIFLIFSYYFIRRAMVREDVPKQFNIAAGVVFLGIGLLRICSTLRDYFYIFNQNQVLLYIGNICMYLGFFPLMLYLEKNIFRITKYILSIISFILFIVFNFMTIYSKFQIDVMGFWILPPLALGFFIIIISYIYLIIKSTGPVRKSPIFIFIGVATICISWYIHGLYGPYGPSPHPFVSDIIAILSPILVILGCFLTAKGFFGYPFDFNWREKLRELYVIYKNGVCLFAYSFEKNIILEDSSIIAGGFTGISIILSEMVKTNKPLQMIDYQDVKIILEQGGITTFVLILKDESPFLQYKLKVFSREFQLFFEEIIKHWNGQTDVFKPTRGLIQRIFEIPFNQEYFPPR